MRLSYWMHTTYGTISLGRRQRLRECEGLRFIESSYEPNARFAPHAHDHGNISLMLRGDLEETVGRDSRCASTCSVVVKPAGTLHSNRFGTSGARTMLIELPALAQNIDRWQWFDGGPVAAAAVGIYRAFRDEATPANELRDLTIDLLATIGQTNASCKPLSSACVSRVRAMLHDSFASSVSVMNLADQLGMHPVYLTRAFRAATGCSIVRYIARLRVRSAAAQLSSTDLAIRHIAARCGFADQAHLTRIFKRETGLTPLRFRQLVCDSPHRE